MVLAGCFVVMAFVYGCGWEPSGVFILPLVKQFGWSRFQVSMLNMALAIALGTSGPLVGWLLDRTGAVVCIMIGAALTAFALLLASWGTTFTALFTAYLMIGAGIGFSTSIPCTYVITQWFTEQRGLALGIFASASSFFGMPMILLSTHLVQAAGWRTAYAVLAVPVFLAIPVAAMTVRSRPRAPAPAAFSPAAQAPELPGLEVRAALAAPAFWMIALCNFSFWFVTAGAVIHMVPCLIGLGYTPTHAALVLMIIYGMGTTGKLAISTLADRFGARLTLSADFLSLGTGLVLFLGASHVAMLAASLLLMGLTCGAPMALLAMIQAESLGLKRYGSLNGLLSIAFTLGMASGPLVAGRMFDVTHSYTAAFMLFGAIAVVASFAASACAPLRAAEAAGIAAPVLAESNV